MITKKIRAEGGGWSSGVETLSSTNHAQMDPEEVDRILIRCFMSETSYRVHFLEFHKMFHVGNQLSGRCNALIPKLALIIEEKAWNAYPYFWMRYGCLFIEKFSLDIKTVYKEDCGNVGIVFKLHGEELNAISVDVIDVVKDLMIGPADYVRDEDPCVTLSPKTGRGPLSESWIQNYWRKCKNGQAIMCANKLCRFKCWSMLAKIERFSHDIALRKSMVRAHRQAWTWQDEWINLAIDSQNQEALAQKMGLDSVKSSSGVGTVSTIREENIRSQALEHSPSTTTASNQLLVSPVAQTAHLWPISFLTESSSEDGKFFDCQASHTGFIASLELRSSGLSLAMARWSSIELMPQEEDGEDLEPAELKTVSRPERYASANQGPPSPRKPVAPATWSFFNRISPGRPLSHSGRGGVRHHSIPSAVPVQPANALILSPEKTGFDGSAADVGDAVRSIQLYDALGKDQGSQCRFGIENSIAEGEEDATSPAAEEPAGIHGRTCEQQQHSQSGGLAPFWHQRIHHHLHPQSGTPCRLSTSAAESGRGAEFYTTSSNGYLDFQVGDYFLLSSPLALVIAFRKRSHSEEEHTWIRSHSYGIYNIFHLMHLLAARLGPLLSAHFAKSRPVSVPRYQRYPLEDVIPTNLYDFVPNNPQLFKDHIGGPLPSTSFVSAQQPLQTGNELLVKMRQSDGSYFHGSSSCLGAERLAAHISSLSQRWWSSKRLDYVPPSALTHIFHDTFWESVYVVAFILRHLMRMDGPATADDFGLDRNVDSADNASRNQDEIYYILDREASNRQGA